jgi:hypothetical protein
MHLQPVSHMDPQMRQRIDSEGVSIPIVGLPATSSGMDVSCTGPGELLEGRGPEPAELAAGEYDVHVGLEMHSEEEEGLRCGRATVSVSGETRVEMPPLEECSW